MTQAVSHKRDWKSLLAKVLKIVLPLSVSVVLVAWLLHKVNIHQIMAIMRQGVDYRYILIMMLLTGLSFAIRGIRWGIQLRAAGIPRIPRTAECVSIFGAYALNLVVTYLGEAWRCLYVTRREHAKLSTVVGTDIGDRASDAVVIIILIILTMFVASGPLEKFMDKYSFGKELVGVISSPAVWAIAAGALLLICVLLYFFRHTRFVQGMKRSALRMWRGFAVLFHLKPGATWWYIALTIGIWACYFFETYSCFYAFPFTRRLIAEPGTCTGFLPGLVVFVFGSCSMAVPSNGGLGPWNIAVMFALTLYGINEADATVYGLVCWSFQAMMIIALGIFSALYIMVEKRSSKPA